MRSRGVCHNLSQVIRTCAFCALAALAACTGGPPAPQAPSAPLLPPSTPPPAVSEPEPAAEWRFLETGIAAWRGREHDGRKTASGEDFDMHGLTAAHRTLPLGAAILVTNLDNFKSVVVTINDRGPFARSRILDLSYGAARELGFVEQGIARVKIELSEALRDSGRYTVQAAVYAEEENARLLKQRLSTKFAYVFIVPVDTNIARFFCVRVGAYASPERAEQIADKLALEGLEPVVLRKDY
jgi:rare lipoprotein A